MIRRFRSGTVRERVMGNRFRAVDLAAGTVKPFAGSALDRNGHPAPSLVSNAVLCDSYPDDEGRQQPSIVDSAARARVDLGRCDLHPRWDRAGRRIRVDSAHTCIRRVHVADVSAALETLAAERTGGGA